MKKIIAIYTVLLLGLTSVMATPNTLYFMEYLPYQSVMNPALQPRCKAYVELPAISTISFYGNTGGISLNDIFYVKDGKLVTYLHPEYGSKDALYSKLMRSFGADAEFDLSLLGFGFKVKEKGYFTFNTSFRVDATLGLPKDIVTVGMYGTPDTVNVNTYDLTTRLAINAYADFNVGYAHQINDKWTVAGRLHILLGLFNANAELKDATLNMSHEEWNISGNLNAKISQPVLNFTTNKDGELTGYTFKEGIDEIFSTYKPSIGAALDLGAVYKPVPEVKISLSVKDLGFMVWETAPTQISGALNYSFEGTELTTSDSDIEVETDDEEELSKLGLSSNNAIGRYASMMNGKIYAGVEYSFLNNMMSVGLVSKTSYNYNHWDEEITIGYNLRPCSWFGLSASYSLISSKSSAIGLGVNLRIPPFSFYVVSDYSPVHYSADGIPYKVSAANVQAGLVLTFGCMKKKAKKAEEELPVIAEDVLPEPTQTEETEQTQVEEQEQTQVEQTQVEPAQVEPAQVEPAQAEEPEPVQVEQTQVEQTQISEQ